MDVVYGKGVFKEEQTQLEGDIILSEHKLFLKGEEGDLTRSYVPLEKIERLKLASNRLDVQVRPTLYIRYVASFAGERSKITALAQEIVKRRGLKKKFLRKEWVEEAE